MRCTSLLFSLAFVVVTGATGVRRAEATECGLARRQVDQLKAAIAVDEAARRGKEVAAARSKLAAIEKIVDKQCVARKANIVALPLGYVTCLLYTSPSPRDRTRSRMPSSA